MKTHLSTMNWLHHMQLDSIDLCSEIPFDFNKKASEISNQPALDIIVKGDPEKPIYQRASVKDRSVDVKNISDSRSLADGCSTLEELKLAVKNFNNCDLKKTAINTVFADGCSDAKIMLIGEAPGAAEDANGIPFCGESGKLLDNIFSAISLSREKNLYITNSVFWRPPANRRPTKEEIEICRPFLEKHISIIKPDLIILVGSTAIASLIDPNGKIAEMRGKIFSYQNMYLDNPINISAIFHPAYLLRQPSKKKELWYDLLRIFNKI